VTFFSTVVGSGARSCPFRTDDPTSPRQFFASDGLSNAW
jgi:hypothetical protein